MTDHPPPSDDSAVSAAIQNALEFLPSLVNLALINGDRNGARDAASTIKIIYGTAQKDLGPERAEEIFGALVRESRERIVQVFGTSAWDDAPSAADAPVTPGGPSPEFWSAVSAEASVPARLNEREAAGPTAAPDPGQEAEEIRKRDRLLLSCAKSMGALIKLLRQRGLRTSPEIILAETLKASIERNLDTKGTH